MQLKRLTILAACLFLLSASGSAQQTPPPNPPRPGDAIKNILDLSDQQLQQLTDLRNTFLQRMRDFGPQLRTLEQRKQELLQSASPDATALGNLLLQEQNLHKQMQDANKAYHDAALALLTSAQKQKATQIQEAVRLAPQAGPLAAFGLIEGPGPGGGPGGPGFGFRFGDVRILRDALPFEAGATFTIPIAPPPGMGPRP